MELNARSLSSSATLPRFSSTFRRLLDTRRFLLKPNLRPCAAAVKKSETRRHGETVGLEADGSDQSPARTLGRSAFAAAAAVLVSLCGCDAQALAESLTVAFPVSKAREVNTVQRTLVEAWGLVRETFLDPTFNHQDWDSKLQQTMVEMFPLKSADAAYSKIRGMLSTLGDPFTKIISPKEYQSFRIGSDGNLQGVGLFINVEPNSGHLIVLSCIEGSPAARAGIHEGDELLEIDGESVAGINSEAAAQKLRGRIGTTVTVKLQSGVEHGSKSSLREVIIPREAIKLSPLSTAVISHRSLDGRESKTGYVRLSTFSQTAAIDMENAIQEMEDQGVQSYILDLRNNPGGLVKAGLDVAQIWLDGDETLVNTVDREGNMLPINMVNGHALTHDPLVVIVNEGSASASEILAGALHDNGRAVLVGNKTFGKGKIQSVTELHDGSALFITVAKYLSPAFHDIDKVGITPDIQCTPDMFTASKAWTSRDKSSAASSLEGDSCIMVAEHELELRDKRALSPADVSSLVPSSRRKPVPEKPNPQRTLPRFALFGPKPRDKRALSPADVSLPLAPSPLSFPAPEKPNPQRPNPRSLLPFSAPTQASPYPTSSPSPCTSPCSTTQPQAPSRAYSFPSLSFLPWFSRIKGDSSGKGDSGEGDDETRSSPFDDALPHRIRSDSLSISLRTVFDDETPSPSPTPPSTPAAASPSRRRSSLARSSVVDLPARRLPRLPEPSTRRFEVI